MPPPPAAAAAAAQPGFRNAPARALRRRPGARRRWGRSAAARAGGPRSHPHDRAARLHLQCRAAVLAGRQPKRRDGAVGTAATGARSGADRAGSAGAWIYLGGGGGETAELHIAHLAIQDAQSLIEDTCRGQVRGQIRILSAAASGSLPGPPGPPAAGRAPHPAAVRSAAASSPSGAPLPRPAGR